MRILLLFLHPLLLAAAAMGLLLLQMSEMVPPIAGLRAPSVLAGAVAYAFYLYAWTFGLWMLAGLFRSRFLARAAPFVAWGLACLLLASPFLVERLPVRRERRSILGWKDTEAMAALVTLPGYLAYEWFDQG